MSSIFWDIVLAIAGPLTQRTLENLRRTLEDLWIKSTAEGADPSSFSPALIAQAHEAAKLDNAKIIVSWALAIHIEAGNAYSQLTEIQKVQGYLATEKDKLAFVQRDAGTTPQVIQTIKANILGLETSLRNLQESAPPILGRPPQAWETGTTPVGHNDLDGNLSSMPPTNS